MAKKILSEYEAALLLRLSPAFLRWCTSYAPKGDGVKLAFIKRGELYYYDQTALTEFNDHLKAPWSKPEGKQRPYLPSGIEIEIKSEAYFRCPVCNTTLGEIAHIDPVSQHLDNHPHNLIYLCPNHHTQYDYGFRIKNVTREDVVHFKKGLQIFHAIRWSLQKDVIESYLGLLSKIGKVLDLQDQIKAIPEEEVDELFGTIIQKIEKIPEQKVPTVELKTINDDPRTAAGTKIRQKAKAYFSTKDKHIQELKRTGLIKDCPLCLTKGSTKDFEICPVCGGEGYIGNDVEPDLRLYEIEDCPLCKGKGSTQYFDSCPPCGGEGRLTNELIQNTDFEKYEVKECPLCSGKGKTTDFDSCPACQGEGLLTNEQIELINFEQYDLETCPLCKGRGRTSDFDTCPACGGEGKLTKEYLAQLDLTKYEKEKCPLCHGKGSTKHFDDCPACGGEGELTNEQLETLDISRFDILDCPVCKGSGTISGGRICLACHGEGKLTRERLQELG